MIKTGDILKRSLWIWTSFIPFGILNGSFRERILAPWLGLNSIEPFSAVVLGAFIFVISLIFIPLLGKAEYPRKTYWLMGGIWMLLTVPFEAVLAFVRGIPAIEVLRAYDITNGRPWLLFVLFMGLVPSLVYRIRKKKMSANE